ncbi:MAG: ribonuclease BN [Proteobacteria bacterium]|nr:MAG: ribonuclease BN [Pseudomonadota bacterium]
MDRRVRLCPPAMRSHGIGMHGLRDRAGPPKYRNGHRRSGPGQSKSPDKSTMIKTIRSQIDRVSHFIETGLWQIRRSEVTAGRWLLIRLMRTVMLSVYGFSRHHGTLRASALTFFTLLSLVPVAAMAFGIAKGFGFERRLQQELLEQFSNQQEVVTQVITFTQNLLNNTKGGMIAGIGIIVLFWAAIKVLSHIEDAFNHIWEVRSRRLVRKLSDYLTIILICPVLMIMSGSVTVFITSQLTAMSGRYELLEMVGPAIYLGLKLSPYALIWVPFTMVYMIMPNTRVRFDAALLAGILAGSAYQIVQAFYIHFQILVAKYNAIYGSFAALPLFLLWLQISWTIVLVGAEISYAFQHSRDADGMSRGKAPSFHRTRLLSLMICRHVVQRFHDNQPPQTAGQIAEALSLTPALVDKLIDLLVQGKILVRTIVEDGEAHRLQPARDVCGLSIHTVVTALVSCHT